MSAALSTSMRVTAACTSGDRVSPDAVTRVTFAPRRAAASASAFPCFPEERLVR